MAAGVDWLVRPMKGTVRVTLVITMPVHDKTLQSWQLLESYLINILLLCMHGVSSARL